MNVWRLTAANTIGKEETEPVPEEGKRKIRITKVFVNRSDALLFSGAKKDALSPHPRAVRRGAHRR